MYVLYWGIYGHTAVFAVSRGCISGLSSLRKHIPGKIEAPLFETGLYRVGLLSVLRRVEAPCVISYRSWPNESRLIDKSSHVS